MSSSHPRTHIFKRTATPTSTPLTATPILGPGGTQPILGPGGTQQHCPDRLLSDAFSCIATYNQNRTSDVSRLDQLGTLIGCLGKAATSDHLISTGTIPATSS